MKWKSFLNIQVDDAFDASESLRKVFGVMACNAVTANEIRLKYDARKTNEEQIRAILKQRNKII
jgi:hypothetical protein